MISLNYICFVNQLTGFSLSARNNIQALLKSGLYDIKITPVDFKPSSAKKVYPLEWDELINKPETSDKIQIYHLCPFMNRRVKKTNRSIAFSVFETYNPPKEWFKLLNQHEAIISPSKFCYDIFSVDEKLKRKMFYAPHCLDTNLYTPKETNNNAITRLLWVGTWKLRKGYDILIQAFKQLNNTDMTLYIKTDEIQKAERYIKGCKNIVIITKKILEEQMPDFLKSFDCIISTSRGEGLGLIPLQSLALKIPLISTYTTGCKDYLSEDVAELIYPEGTTKIERLDGIAQYSSCSWDYFRVESVVSAIKNIGDNYQKCLEKIENGYQVFLNSFTYSKFLDEFNNCLKSIMIK